MKYRVISGWVTVTGPPLAICCLNRGTTEPQLPNTLPKRTATNSVLLSLLAAWTIISAMRLVAPMTLVGLMALSVEIMTKRFTPYSIATCTTL